MYTLLKFLFRNANPVPTGALLDTRKPEQKKDDVHFSEIVSTANPVQWTEKYPNNIRKFPDLNQNRTLSCGANALAKAMGTLLYSAYGSYIALSRAHIYQRRANRPYPGMMLSDMFRIAQEGATLEVLVKTKGEDDADLDGAAVEPWMKKEGETWKVTQGIYVNNDIDTIASIIQTTGKGVILLTWFLAGEWSKEIPYIVNYNLGKNDPDSLRHFVVAVDFTMYNGKKYLIIEDSAWFGGLNRRLVSEEWVSKRIAGGGYLMNFKFQGTPVKPSYDGNTIISAQKCLQFEGLFPSNVGFVENVGPVTRTALINFQKKYALTVSGIIDAMTQNKLHHLYP